MNKISSMVNPLNPFGEIPPGNFYIEEISQNHVEIFYSPSEENLLMSGLVPDISTTHRVKLLEIDGRNQHLTIFPTNMIASHRNFLKPKYHQIQRITLICNKMVYIPADDEGLSDSKGFFRSPYFGKTEPMEQEPADTDSLKTVPSTQKEVVEVLEGLPPIFSTNPDQGLEIKQRYRFIIDAVEKLSDCTEIVISDGYNTAIDEEENIFYISAEDFETTRKSINSINRISRTAANSVVAAETYNLFAEKVGKQTIPVEVGRHPLRKQITTAAQGKELLSDNDQENMLNLLTKNAAVIATAKPEKLAKLQADIDLVNLQTLATQYEKMINKKCSESVWQTFFRENPFILHLAFGYPVIKVQDQASVGGRKVSGVGEKITDFLVKNRMTNNIAIIEIKTPQKNLLNKKTYRCHVYAPTTELVGSINQVLDQKRHFEGQIAQIKENSRIRDIEAYAVHCCLLIGVIPSDEDQQKSFELFRGNSMNVKIITFDELLTKLKDLLSFLLDEKQK